MAIGTLMPLPRFTGWDLNGNPISGGQLWTYIAGTSTPTPVYTDVALTVPHTNPILLNAAGRVASAGGTECGVYLTPGSSYKFVLQNAAGATVWTQDNVSAVPTSSQSVDIIGTAGEAIMANGVVYLSNGAGGKAAGQWFLTDADFPYASSLATTVGVALAAIPLAAQGAIRIQGTVSFAGSPFTPGTIYYAHPTAGTLTATVPSNARSIGQALDISTLLLGGGIAASNIVFSTPLTGLQHNLAVPSGVSVVYFTGTASLQLTGIAAGVPGQSLTLVNFSTFQVDLLHNNAGSSAGNKFLNIVSTGPTSLAPSNNYAAGSARYIYDTTGNWRLQQHEQGDWINVPYSAGNFGTNIGAWTVTAGNVSCNKYYIIGKTMWWILTVNNTSHAACNALVPAVPAAFQPAVQVPITRVGQAVIAGTTAEMVINSTFGPSALNIAPISGAVLAAATNNTIIAFIAALPLI